MFRMLLSRMWNYLRVRGEYRYSQGDSAGHQELPPRARRIHIEIDARNIIRGTTSACAENTGLSGAQKGLQGNYLRVRGEYCYILDGMPSVAELPPRARRIHCDITLNLVFSGTTSACAENTPRHLPGRSPRRNYLRVRGEYLYPRWVGDY